MRALIFDFDGLILDTETPEFRVWTEIFSEHGVAMPPDYWIQVIGRGAEQQIERPPELLTRLTGNYVETEAATADRRSRILALIDQERVRPGVVELLDEAEEAGIPVGIASSSRHNWVEGYLAKLGLRERFPVIVCADDVARAKPFPDLYLLACERLRVEPSSAVALEDSPNGTAAAKAAGLFTVAVPNPVTAALDLSRADMRVESLSAIKLSDLRSAFAKRRDGTTKNPEPAKHL